MNILSTWTPHEVYVGIATSVAGTILLGVMLAVIRLSRNVSRLMLLKVAQLTVFNKDFEVLADFSAVWRKLDALMAAEIKNDRKIVIRNIGLDLEVILPEIKKFIEREAAAKSQLMLDYRGLIVNPGSVYIRDLIDDPPSNIHSNIVQGSVQKISDYERDLTDYQNIKLSIFSYDVPIIIHGVLVDIFSMDDKLQNGHLMLGFTELQRGKMRGSDKPYIYMKSDPVSGSTATRHYFDFFKEWFDYYFNKRSLPQTVSTVKP